MHVLIVEDDPTLAFMLHSMLTQEGMDVTVVSDDFVRLIDQPSMLLGIDVLVCDLMMPGISGTDILRSVKEHSPHVRRVILSAVEWKVADEPDLADAILAKPTSVADTIAAIRGPDGV